MPEEGWLPAGFNDGWSYRDRIAAAQAGQGVVAYYAGRWSQVSLQEWQRRLAAGEISRNGEPLENDAPLRCGDRLVWRRPPWREEAVPAAWGVIHDDGDLLVIDKPRGLPVLPAGGFLEHTLLRMLERQVAAQASAAPVPRPVHRLGRFTSGLLVCARRSPTRAWLSARLRESTGTAADEPGAGACRKQYRALVVPGVLDLAPGESRPITTPIGGQPHGRLGRIWCAHQGGLPARSRLTLLEHGLRGDLVQVEIATGRPHQIRIHCAAIGAPLLDDPLYLPGGGARPDALPGEGGYRLHAHRLALALPSGGLLNLEAPLPADLHGQGEGPPDPQPRSKAISREK